MSVRRIAEGVFGAIERVVTALLYPPCLVAGWLGRRPRIPILMYHQIGRPLPGSIGGAECVSPARFERQIDAVLSAGYRVIPFGRLLELLAQGRPADLRRTAVLTFDDGLLGQFVHACPALARRGLRATFFLIAGPIGTYTPYPHLAPAGGWPARVPEEWLPVAWTEALAMVRAGMEIGCHSLTHRSLGALGAEEIAVEIGTSKELLEQRLGVPVRTFAYPFGSAAYGDFSAAVQRRLREAGYRGACTTVVGTNTVGSDPMALRRIPMQEGDGPFRVRCKLAGACDWVGPVKSAWQRLVARRVRVDLPALVAARERA